MGDGISFKIAGYVDLDMLHMFAGKEQFNIYSRFFCEIFLSVD
jgi:hypothetical protein